MILVQETALSGRMLRGYLLLCCHVCKTEGKFFRRSLIENGIQLVALQSDYFLVLKLCWYVLPYLKTTGPFGSCEVQDRQFLLIGNIMNSRCFIERNNTAYCLPIENSLSCW